MAERLLTNARLVLAEEVVHGTLRLRDGAIAEIAAGATAVKGAEDMEGDTLLAGLIELHTEHVEKHVLPRPGGRGALLAEVMAQIGDESWGERGCENV